MGDTPQMRVSDADRERLSEELREHTVDGRLSPEELEQRLEAAYSARTSAELQALRVDLPLTKSATERAHVQRRANLRRRLLQEAGGSLTVSAISVAAWVASGAQGAFWPIWVILFTLLPLLRDGWRLLGPGSDLDAVEARLQARHQRGIAREVRRGARLPPPSRGSGGEELPPPPSSQCSGTPSRCRRR